MSFVSDSVALQPDASNAAPDSAVFATQPAAAGQATAPEGVSVAADNFRESHARSLLKALSWRVVAAFTTGLIAYLITGQVATALTIGAIEFVLKFVVYYLHERLWQMLPRGSVRQLVLRS